MAEEVVETVPPKKGRGKLLIVIILAVLILGGGAFGYFFFIKGKKEKVKKEEKVTKKSYIGPLLPLRTFVVNLNDPSGRKYLKVTIDLELSNDAVKTEIMDRMPQIRDTIITFLSTTSYEDLSSVEGKNFIKEAITAKINRILTSGKVKNIYFEEFVVQ